MIAKPSSERERARGPRGSAWRVLALSLAASLSTMSAPALARGVSVHPPFDLTTSAPYAAEQAAAHEANIAPEVRERLARPAEDLAPWQREFMMRMARDSHPGSPGYGTASPSRVTSADGIWAEEKMSPQTGTAIYDPVRGRMVVLSGNDVWALSLTGDLIWTKLAPAGTPPGRGADTAIYDPVRDRIVVFGGDHYDLNDVWALSLAGSPAWTQLTPAGTPPSPRQGYTVIYDPVRDRIVVFGGDHYDGADHYLNDVWTLSLAGSPAWTQLTPAGTPPSGRIGHTAIYDPVRDCMVVFGGVYYDGAEYFFNDVWGLSLAGSPAWTELTPPGTSPSARAGHNALYDPVRDLMVVFGGNDSWGNYLNDVWALSLVGSPAWTELTPPGTPWGLHTALYDPVHDRVVALGSSDGIFIKDYWELSLAGSPAWAHFTITGTPPSRRADHTAIYDPVRDRMVMLGGYIEIGDVNDVWALSLTGTPAWTLLTSTGRPPSGLHGHTAIYDPVRDRMVVFGGGSVATGLVNDVWALSLSGNPAWTQLTPAGTPPIARENHTAIYDPVRDRMVVFGGGGGGLNDVWALSLDGNPAWTQLTLTGTPPGARYSHTAIYDPVGDRMVVFGGEDSGNHSINDVWALSFADGMAWTEITPAGTPPSARFDHTAIYDPTRDRMVVFGGRGGDFVNDVWALSLEGNPAWTQLTPGGTGPPVPRGSHTAIYDAARDRMVVFAGSGGGPLHDVWDLQWAPTVSVPPPATSDRLLLAAAYPNPARSDVSIGFTLPRKSAATLRVYDVSGRLARTLVEGTLPAGSHLARWDRRLSSGVRAQSGLYFYELRADGHRLSRRIVLME